MEYSNILRLQPEELFTWLDREFNVSIPKEIQTVADMENASKILLMLAGYQSYLSSLLAYAEIITRQAKRTLPKAEYEDSVDKKKVIQAKIDSIKQMYTAVSRAVTIKIENNAELHMNGPKCGNGGIR